MPALGACLGQPDPAPRLRHPAAACRAGAADRRHPDHRDHRAGAAVAPAARIRAVGARSDHHVRRPPGDPSRAARRRRPPAGDRGPVLDPRLRRRARLRVAPRRRAPVARARSRRGDARVFREAAHDGRLEGPHQRPPARRQLPDQRGIAPRPPHPARDQRARTSRRHRIPRHDHAAVHRRPDRLGRDRRAHHREPGAPRAGVRAVVPGRLQERHQRRRAHRRRRDQGGVRAAPLPVGDQGRALGDRAYGRQRGLPHHPARRPRAELRCGERRCDVARARRRRPRRTPDDRLLARQQPQAAHAADRRSPPTSPRRCGRRHAHHRRSCWKATSTPAGRTSCPARRSPTACRSPTPASAGTIPCRRSRRLPRQCARVAGAPSTRPARACSSSPSSGSDCRNPASSARCRGCARSCSTPSSRWRARHAARS